MKVEKEDNRFGLRIHVTEGDKYLSFTFGGNGDLYWSIHSKDKELNDSKYEYFIITNENYGLYNLFNKLYDDIENINLYDNDDDMYWFINDNEEQIAYMKRKEEDRLIYKSLCREYNKSHYNDLFNKEEKTITWHSDEVAWEVSNIVKITKLEDSFKIEFFVQDYKEGYDEDFHSLYYIPIRFRNSGSSYDPFNILFMNMYNNMKYLDDYNDINHQIHIEEYLYREKNKKLLKDFN